MNYYKCSNGDRVSKAEIDRRVTISKRDLLRWQKEEHGYNFCEECFRNDCLPLDCSHIISVDECQKSGRSELAWDAKNNMRVLGRKCHQMHDGLNLKFKSK